MTTLQGIDISHYQSGLSIAKAGVDFAIMKATEGTGYTDPTCDGFVSQAKNAGALFGVYHFAHTGSDAEADYFIKATKGYHGKGILALDWEADAVGHGVSAAKNWLDRVYSKTGIRPLIYMSESVARDHDWSSVAGHYALWVARYGSSSYGDVGAWAAPAMWQHTSAGSVPGYSGHLDLDRFYGDRAAWTSFAAGEPAPEPAPEPKPDDGKPPQIAVDGIWGSGTTKRLQQVLGTKYTDGEVSRQAATWRDDNPGLTSGWQWDGHSGDGGSPVIKAVQGRVGVTKDGKAGPTTFKAMQRHYGTPVDGVVSHPSTMVKAMQRALNEGRF